MDVKEKLHSVFVLIEDACDDLSFRFREGTAAVESVHANEVTGVFGPVNVKVSVQVHAQALEKVGIVSVAVLAP